MDTQISLDKYAPAKAAYKARRLITRALGAGYFVSVNDGEVWTVKKSDDKAVILAALASTDSDVLKFRDSHGQSKGWVMLIWENDEDVISDYADNETMRALVEGI